MKIKIIAIAGFFLLGTLTVRAQQSTLEKALADSTCKHINKIQLDTVKTQEQKRNALSVAIAQAARENEKVLKNDKRFKGLTTYEQGRQIGIWMSQYVFPIMVKDCPKFVALMSK